jgi:dual specificity phosphatase 12
MRSEFKNVDTTDYNLTYFISNVYTKANCIIRSFISIDNTFEANEVIPGLYIGNINSVYDIKKLKELGITHVISVLSGFEPPYPNDFNYLVLDALDTVNTDLSLNFETTNDFINDAFDNFGKVLIHCMAGRSRSATIMAAFIIKTFGTNVETAIDIMKTKRDIVEPNPYFKKQLLDYYDKNYKESELQV